MTAELLLPPSQPPEPAPGTPGTDSLSLPHPTRPAALAGRLEVVKERMVDFSRVERFAARRARAGPWGVGRGPWPNEVGGDVGDVTSDVFLGGVGFLGDNEKSSWLKTQLTCGVWLFGDLFCTAIEVAFMDASRETGINCVDRACEGVYLGLVFFSAQGRMFHLRCHEIDHPKPSQTNHNHISPRSLTRIQSYRT